MATIRKWQDEISILSDIELDEIEKALKILKNWELFEREFEGLVQLRVIVSEERMDRFFKLTFNRK